MKSVLGVALLGPSAFWLGIVLALLNAPDPKKLDGRLYRVEFCIPTQTRTRTPEWQ